MKDNFWTRPHCILEFKKKKNYNRDLTNGQYFDILDNKSMILGPYILNIDTVISL